MFAHHGRSVGWIEVICGPMFSGKTEEMLRRTRLALIAKQKVQIFKPAIDTRHEANVVTSHSDQTLHCLAMPTARDLLQAVRDQTRVVAIDEVQFFDDTIVDVCQKLADRGVRVIVAGLDQDYLGRPFGPMPHLLCIAEFLTKNQAICVVCGGLGTKSQRLLDTDAQVALGAMESYQARCRSCFDPEGHAEHVQTALPMKVVR